MYSTYSTSESIHQLVSGTLIPLLFHMINSNDSMEQLIKERLCIDFISGSILLQVYG